VAGGFRKQFAQRRPAARQPKRRLEVPAGEEHRVARSGEVLLQAAERVLAVDEHLELVAVARRRLAGAPEPVVRWVIGVLPAVPFQASPVMGDDEPLDSGADCVVNPIDACHRHRPRSVSAQIAARAR
jgi:hypothetical protein